jgi:hypothetical protein
MLMMASSRTHVSGSGITTMRTLIALSSLLLLALSSCIISPVTSFLLPRQQIQHQPSSIRTSQPISSASGGEQVSTKSSSLLHQSSNSQDGATTTTTTEAPASKRAQRKAAQRVKKERLAKQTQSSNNKITSQHPEAILKRQLQTSGNNNNKRRNHNFAQRAEYLSGGTTNGFEDDLDSLTLTIQKNPDNNNTTNNNNNNNNGNTIQYHQLHSQRVSKLDASTKPDDVVKAIKRAQNLHDEHDIVEIAHFLLEEVGEFLFLSLCYQLFY